MGLSFYLFDLETSGFRADSDRIMQFAGQRTDMDLKLIGKSDNILVKLSEDILPQPEAVLVHGITPQKARKDGMSEAELVKYLTSQVFTPDTIMVGYNNIRFDNNFIRFLLWRNFTDAYEWVWKDGASTWDLLDVARMTRALRPEGIKWPFASDGKPTNRLELLASINKLQHDNAHDALSDVNAVIELARLIKTKQPKLFDYLLKHRGKNMTAPLVASGKPFIYTSGRYPGEWLNTTIAVQVAPHPDRDAALVYDLRIDPDEFKNLSVEQLVARWQARGSEAPYFPVKQLVYNRCPAIVGDLRVLDKAGQERLGLHMEIIQSHLAKLQALTSFGDKLTKALQIMNKPYQTQAIVDELQVDSALYSGFIKDDDKTKMQVVRAADEGALAGLQLDFADERLKLLLPLYKARNFPSSLSADEQKWWRQFKSRKLDKNVLNSYFDRLSELSASGGHSTQANHLLAELVAYGESVKAQV